MKRARLASNNVVSTLPIAIPNTTNSPRITIDALGDENENDDDDEVFDKENAGRLLSPRRHKRTLFPSVTNAKELCVNSPGRKELQTKSLASILEDVKVLGRGSFGSVILGTWRGKRVAVKVISRETQNTGLKSRCDSVTNELNAKDLSHENVVKVFGVYPDPELNSVIIMEYVGKYNLQTLLDTQPSQIDDQFTHRCFTGVAAALAFIHSSGVLHLDVKPGNVFVTSDGVCKLGDFGCSRKVAEGKQSANLGLLVGTSGYQAPEYLKNKTPTEKCDTYAFGVVMWQVVTREAPFSSLHPHAIIFQVVTHGRRPDEGKATTSPYKNLYQSCWQDDPHSRPTMQRVSKLLKSLVPTKRRTSSIRI